MRKSTLKMEGSMKSSIRPKAALLFWFFGDFRCGALLFMVIHVIYIYIYIKISKNSC